MSKFKIYLKAIIIPLALGGLVGLLISTSMDYGELQKPILAPPSIIFPIVWTTLYILMGISYGILESNEKVTGEIKLIYYAQLIVNLLWPIAFFILKWRLFAFIWILLLDILVVIMIIKFYQQNKTAGLLQIPYIIWTSFASYLNLFMYLLNK